MCKLLAYSENADINSYYSNPTLLQFNSYIKCCDTPRPCRIMSIGTRVSYEGVDGIAFTSITEDDLKELKIKTGPRKRIMNLINEANQVDCLVVPSVGALTHATENLDGGNTSGNGIVGDLVPIANSRNISRGPNSSADTSRLDDSQKTNSATLLSVREWIEKYDTAQMRNPPLINILDSGVVEPKDRRELVRIVCTELVKLNNSMYPPTLLKKQLAEEIIRAFPKLRSNHPNIAGYEHFYDAKTNHGFIEFRLKTLRLNLSPSKKRRAALAAAKQVKRMKGLSLEKVSKRPLSKNDFDDKVVELSMKMPNDTNKDEIFRLTDETRPNRQEEMKDPKISMSVADILQKYPRFKDFNGELIHREYVSEFPENDKFLVKFVSFYVPRILQYCKSIQPNLLKSVQDIHDDNLKALILLPELLPSPNFNKRMKVAPHKESKNGKGKAKSKTAQGNFSPKTIPNENLLQYVHPAHDLLSSQPTTAKKFKNIQPFLVCSMTGSEKKGIFFIKTDGHLIEIGNDAMIAFDILLKFHYCFDIQFAADLIFFYDFITSCILQFTTPKGCCTALNTTFNNISLRASVTDVDSENSSTSESEGNMSGNDSSDN